MYSRRTLHRVIAIVTLSSTVILFSIAVVVAATSHDDETSKLLSVSAIPSTKTESPIHSQSRQSHRSRSQTSSSSEATLRPRLLSSSMTALTPDIILRPGRSLADRFSNFVLVNSSSTTIWVEDFLDRLRAEEAQWTASLQCKNEIDLSLSDSLSTTANWAWKTLQKSGIILFAAVLMELDWRQLLNDFLKSSTSLLSVIWIPFFWMRPGASTATSFEMLVVYLLAVARPEALLHLWQDILLPHTIPNLKKMILSASWSMFWKVSLASLMPVLPKNATGCTKLHIFVLASIHKGILKLATGNIQGHVHTSLESLYTKASSWIHSQFY